MNSNLTSIVLTVSLVACPTYLGADGARRRKASRAEHVTGLLSSYAEAMGDFGSSYVYRFFSGKQPNVEKVVEFYRDGTSRRCPRLLYEDVKDYLNLPSISRKVRAKLWEDLYDVLEYIPGRDRQEMIAAVNACGADGVSMLLTRLLWYSWCSDLAQYTHSSVITGRGISPSLIKRSNYEGFIL